MSEMEKGIILGLHGEGLSLSAIRKRTGRNRSVFRNYLKDPEAYGKVKRSGRKPKLSSASKRALLRLARKGDLSTNQIHKDLSLPITTSRVKQILLAEPNLVWQRIQRAPQMGSIHM